MEPADRRRCRLILADSYVKLSTPTLGVLDYFTPFNQSNLDANDSDVGRAGLRCSSTQRTHPMDICWSAEAKRQIFFLLNRDNMGKYNTSDAVRQEWQGSSSSFQTPGFWNNNLYYFGVVFGSTTGGTVFPFNPSTRMFGTTSTATTPSKFGFAGATPSISASSATTDGIVWAIDTANWSGTAAQHPTAARRGGPADSCMRSMQAILRRSCGIVRRIRRARHGGKCGEVHGADRCEWKGVHRHARKRQHSGRRALRSGRLMFMGCCRIDE